MIKPFKMILITTGGSVPVPLRFTPVKPGRYPCKILLTSWYDVRLYYIEGVVNEEHPEARFEFETPAFEALTQNIPLVSTNFYFVLFFFPTATVSESSKPFILNYGQFLITLSAAICFSILIPEFCSRK